MDTLKLKLKRPFEILLVEDNPADIEILRRFLQEEINFNYRISVINDGETAATCFKNVSDTQQHLFLPDLVILDLNLPQVGGLELLEIFKKDKALAKIPVIIFTTSNNPNDVSAAYERHVNSYIIKPFDIREYKQIISIISQYWLQTVSLPTLHS